MAERDHFFIYWSIEYDKLKQRKLTFNEEKRQNAFEEKQFARRMVLPLTWTLVLILAGDSLADPCERPDVD